MRRLLLALALPLLLATASPARASCRVSLVVEGRFLEGESAVLSRLPPDAGRVDAAWPACNDAGQDELDTPTSATRLEGIPAGVAVRRKGTLFVDFGSLVHVRGHPLRDAVEDRPRRRRGPCRGRRLRGRARPSGGGVYIRDRHILADRRTRISNRPAYEPVTTKQPLAVKVSRCRNGHFADTITFVGPKREPYRYEPRFGLKPYLPWMVLGALGLAATAVVAGAMRTCR